MGQSPATAIGVGLGLPFGNASAGGGPGPDPIPGIASIIARWDASNAGTITLNTVPDPDRVLGWEDTAGAVANDLSNTSGSDQPDYALNSQNGLAGVDFSRTNQISLETGPQAEIDDLFVGGGHAFFVMKFPGVAIPDRRFWDKNSRPTVGGSTIMGPEGDVNRNMVIVQVYAELPSGTANRIHRTSNNFFVPDTTLIVEIEWNTDQPSNTPIVRKDGTSVTITSTDAGGTPVAPPRSDSSNDLLLGGQFGGNGSALCILYEVVLSNAILSSGDRTSVFDYLQNKWGTP